MNRFKICFSAILVLLIATGCQQTIPKEALQLTQESLELRQMQTRAFDTRDEKKILTAAAGVIQDLGFNIDESETALGVIVGSKDRDATETGQVVGAIFMAVMFGASVPIDKNQKIRASLVTKKSGKSKTSLRVTFQRIVWDTQGNVSRTESLEEPVMYQEFFEKLSKSVFLEAHSI